MKRVAGNMRSWFPRRRGRHWRYVSPHRRGAGVVFLALLTVGVGAYWFVPRMVNKWTRTEAAAYLRSITGGRVRVREGRFNLFGGIEIGRVTIDAPNSTPAPGQHLFQADTVVLRHRPWSLISKGRLEPTEVICIGPSITLGYDANTNRYDFEELIAQISRSRSSDGKVFDVDNLPVISFRDVRLRVLDREKLLNISMIPADGAYRIVIEELRAGEEPIRATWVLDLATGEVELLEGTVPEIDHTDTILPDQYAQWRKRYNIRGKVVLKGRPASATSPAFLDAELTKVSLQFPREEGGMEMSNVYGTLTFRTDGVTARNLTGSLAQAGNAAFTLSGQYGGYDANSPLELTIHASGMTVPAADIATGWLAGTLETINNSFKPVGKFDLGLNIRRQADGQVEFHGTAKPLGMSVTYHKFPYRVGDAVGTLIFTGDANGQWLTLEDVRGRHGSARLVVNGRAGLRKRDAYDVTVRAEDLTLDEPLHQAIPAAQRHLWGEFSPAGLMGRVKFRIWASRGDDPNPGVDMALSMDGRCSMEYEGFPYRLEHLTGQVRLADDRVAVDSVTGRRGPMRCTVDGTVSGLSGPRGQTNLTIEATDVPLDANLIAALPKWAQPETSKMKIAGLAHRVSAWVRQPAGQPLDFRVAAHIKDTSFRPGGAPYAIHDANGVLTVRPDRVTIDQLQARHGEMPVHASGQILLDPNSLGLDLLLKTAGTKLNDELFKALPPALQKTWTTLEPSGQADVELSIRTGMPDQKRPIDYRLVLDARGMGMRYADFPYAMTDITGRAVATPDEIRLIGFTGRHGDANMSAEGRITFTAEAETADLVIRGSNVPLDKELLGAFPASLAPLAKRVQPGGLCQLDIKRLKIVQPIGEPNAPDGPSSTPATMPASAPSPASAPATAPATTRPAGNWLIDGRVIVDSATVDIGLGHKTLSGAVTGTATQMGQDLSVDAAIELDSVRVGKQQLTKLSGRLSKKPGGNMMRLTNLSALAHGGQVLGFAEIRLVDPQEFGLSLSVRELRLEDMVASVTGTAAAAAMKDKVKGLLTGNVQLTSIEGPNPRRQASGVLKVTRGELYRLPVMLGLLNVLYLKLPGDTAFTDCELTYHLRNDDLIFDDIYLRGPAMSIVGSGRMDMKTEKLKLTFLSGPPQKLPRLGGLGELLDGIARELVEIHVDGTLAKPRMETMPLRSLDRLLRDLMNPGRPK